MKRIYPYSLLLIAALIPVSMISAQEKKNEQKIKVVIEDGSGVRTVIDTTYSGSSLPKTIKTSDGKIIIISDKDSDLSAISDGEGDQKVFVTVSSGSDNKKNADNKVIVISSDKDKASSSFTTTGDGNVYILKKADGSSDKTMTIASSKVMVSDMDGNEGDKVIIIKDAKSAGKEESYTVTLSSDRDEKTDVSKYVIAKDGLVITVEGNDEVKAEEIIKMIQDKLDVKVDTEGKEIKKEVSKKTVKNN